mgnify:CR=1 FL=1
MSNSKKKFTHLSKDNVPRIVDVSEKSKTNRVAVSQARVHLGKELAELIKKTKSTKKGPVIETAVIAGIQGAKKTSELIPLCHPLTLNGVNIGINIQGEYAIINVTAKTYDRTGVEMEALTAASVAALTIYDMCKSINKSIPIESIHLLKKTGGKSGIYLKK